MNDIQTWHYGLVAQDWAELETETGPEVDYFADLIRTTGQPALDLGCGTGRLLLPFLREDLDVDGCDVSPDMLARCRELARAEGRTPNLYTQAMHELDLPRRYRTIIACGVVGLGGSRQLTRAGFRRCYDHLRPGGVFAFDYQPRWNDPPAWMSRLPQQRHALPDQWPISSDRRRLADGAELEIAQRTVAMNALDEVATRQIRARLWREDRLVQEEVHTQQVEDYNASELELMLEMAGFTSVDIYGDYSDEAATSDHRILLFVCRKSGRPVDVKRG